jgi:hypothetical protein
LVALKDRVFGTLFFFSYQCTKRWYQKKHRHKPAQELVMQQLIDPFNRDLTIMDYLKTLAPF